MTGDKRKLFLGLKASLRRTDPTKMSRRLYGGDKFLAALDSNAVNLS
jgi:hypothetical protein